jgi:DNA (cytosine-5)-methyltransferase 1
MGIKNPHSWLISDLDDVPKNNINVFETFACGGGSSLGYKLAGCNVIGGNDIDAEMAYHYKLNLKPKHYYLCPVKELVNNKSLPDEFFNLDILSGSPPCSSFSMAGNREKDWGKDKHFREGQSKQVLDDLFFDYLDLVEYLKPKVCIAENVKGLIQGNAKGYVKLIMERFRDVGYRCQLFLVNAADCGVPQRRERVFFIALRNDIDKPKLILAPQHRWVSAGEATSDLQMLNDDEIRDTKPTNEAKECYPVTKKGESFALGKKRLGKKENAFCRIKIDNEKPSSSLTAHIADFYHWDICRRLTYREWKRLGSFPDDYQAKNDKIGKYMVGMSVPPKMTKTIATAVVEQWLS